MPDESLTSLLHHAAFAPLPEIGWLRVTGEDRVRWLNGMTTNSIQSLEPGQGRYTFFLNAQGRIQGDATAWMYESFIVLETARDRVATLQAMLDRFIIMDNVELTHLSDTGQAMLLVGPEAPALLSSLGLSPVAEPLRIERQVWRGQELELVRRPGIVPVFEAFGSAEAIASLQQALAAAGIVKASPGALEQMRILEGTPLFGTDIRDKDLPQETAPAGTQSRALHFSKGCYLGQEIVERIHARGNLHRTFSGFLLSGQQPPPGTVLTLAEAPDKAVGELTSVAPIGDPADGGEMFALGYIRREVLERGTARGAALIYPGGTATAVSLPHKLPGSP